MTPSRRPLSWDEVARWGTLCLLTLTILAFGMFAPGCASHTTQISKAATEVRVVAESSTKHAKAIISIAAQCPPDDPAAELVKQISEEATAIVADQAKITSVTDIIQQQLTHVQDKTPWWATLLKLWAWVLLIVLVAGAGLYLGIWPIVRTFIQGLGFLIPKHIVTQASFDANAVVTGTANPPQREAIAAQRASNKPYNKVFTKVKADLEKAVATAKKVL